MTQEFIKANTVPVSKNLLLQAVDYFKQHPTNPMAQMLLRQFQFCLREDAEPTAPEETYEEA